MGFFDVVFSPLNILQNHVSIFLISFALTIVVLILNRIFVNKDLIREIKNKMADIRENLTKAQKEGNKENVEKFLSELMKVNNEYMKHSFKSLMVSLIVLSLFFPWLNYKYAGLTVATLPFNLPIIGSKLTWLYWYILVSFTIGWVIRKIFNLE